MIRVIKMVDSFLDVHQSVKRSMVLNVKLLELLRNAFLIVGMRWLLVLSSVTTGN